MNETDQPGNNLPRPRPRWQEIRLAYINNEGSLATLAKRFNVPLRTLERRCATERWRSAVQQAGGIASAVATELAAEFGRELALTARGLIERTLRDSQAFLDRISSMLASPLLDPAALRALVSAHKDTIGVARTALGMDREDYASNFAVSVQVLGDLHMMPISPAEPSAAAGEGGNDSSPERA